MHGALAHTSTSARHCSRQDPSFAKLTAVETKSGLGATATTDGSCVYSMRHQGGLAHVGSEQYAVDFWFAYLEAS